MKQSFTKDGWTFNMHDRNMDLFTLPSKSIFKNDDWYVYECSIAHSQGLTRQVFFVDYKDGLAWETLAQCKSLQEAIEVLRKQGVK